MKFSVRMLRPMVLHVLYFEKGNGNVLYHFSEKRVVPVQKQMKRSIFSSTCNCGQMVRKFPGIPVKARKRDYLRNTSKGTSKGITFFTKTFHRDEPFHLNSPRNYRKFHSNGKRSLFFSQLWFRRLPRKGKSLLQKTFIGNNASLPSNLQPISIK